MAGTVVITEGRHSLIQEVKFEWTASAGGAADAVTLGAFSGRVLEVITVPGAGGAQPTDLYDLTLKDANGIDVLHGGGANRSNVNTEYVGASLGAVANSPLTLAVTNAGNAKSGVLIVHLGQ